MRNEINLRLGAHPIGGNRSSFLVWAPSAYMVDVHFIKPIDRYVRLTRVGKGYHTGIVENAPVGSRYFYRLNDSVELPDPASRYQPDGVHAASEVVDQCFEWTDDSWRGLCLDDFVIYELHVGTFSTEGTFGGVIKDLNHIVDLGVTAIELMPVAQFSGVRNWGYDGVYPFAVQNSYGGPSGLKRLVDACHNKGLAVVMDVVYNHLGPEGNYTANFGPYFTDRYKTAWGPAVNFDGPLSDEVRRFIIENARTWITEFHIDALRLDAIHSIYDFSASHILKELADEIHCLAQLLDRKVWAFAESDLNDSKVITSQELGGHGLDAQWNDDFHHCLHALITAEKKGYYRDFGGLRQLATAIQDGFVFSGQFSGYRQRSHGNSSCGIALNKFVVFCQNHDQVGNRPLGDRLSANVSFETLKLAAGLTLLSPSIPLIFMGEEYGEPAGFPYFVSYSDKDLIQAVRHGRHEDLSALWGRVDQLDPQDETTFLNAKLELNLAKALPHSQLLEFYKTLIRYRKTSSISHVKHFDRHAVKYSEKNFFLLVNYKSDLKEISIIFNFNTSPQEIRLPLRNGQWTKIIDSSDSSWGGSGGITANRIVSDGEPVVELNARSLLIMEYET